MKVLLDHNMPVQIAPLLEGHLVFTTRQMKWDLLRNGTLLRAAEEAGFEVIVSGDKKMLRQYTRLVLTIGVVIVGNPHREVLVANLPALKQALARACSGSVEEIWMPKTRDFLQSKGS